MDRVGGMSMGKLKPIPHKKFVLVRVCEREIENESVILAPFLPLYFTTVLAHVCCDASLSTSVATYSPIEFTICFDMSLRLWVVYRT